ncbi:putative tRNA methyltransferase 9-like protein [Acipenser ruthenus]|uniref:Putative tRNA methyltransferase 9-like protein n=1 Tax=Acipenser ruthenus TaxID=7906 RepID=A0A662YTQ1_ACIRT|nr:putative tRNA methyltransferase 9-like protein [Acipenser ruthenus]
MKDLKHRMEKEAIQLEKQHVHSVYEKTAPYLSDLRCKAWPRVKQFLLDQEPGSLIADIGCGTGKYLSVNNQIYNLGCDYCSPLVEKARKQGHEVLVCDNLQLPFRDQVFNAVISIGVIHHFSTKERRIRAIREIARTIIPGGMVMIYAWALEQKRRRFEKQDVFVPWNKALCSRNPSESGENASKDKPIDMHPTVYSEDYSRTDALRKEISTKRSYSLGSYISVGRCCIKIPEEQEKRLYSGLRKSLHSWFFSKSLDESSMKKYIEKMKPLRSSEGWVDNAVLVQPSRHCSIDLEQKRRRFEKQDVFVPWNKALCSRNPSESGENASKDKPIDMHPTVYSEDYSRTDALRKEISTKRSYSLGSYISVGRCCIKIPEEQEKRLYSGLRKSLHSWFFSKSLDESSMKKYIEKMKPLRSSEGWVDNAVLVQPSRHCSIDLGHDGSLLNGQSFEEDDVFVETTNHEEAQWWKDTGTLREMNAGHQGVVNRKNGQVNGKQYKPTVNGTNDLNSMSNRIFQRTSTLDSTDSILDAIDVEDEQDNLVDTKDFMRYYHVFKEGELSHLIKESVNELHIVSSCFDHGNWCVIAKRKAPGVSAL